MIAVGVASEMTAVISIGAALNLKGRAANQTAASCRLSCMRIIAGSFCQKTERKKVQAFPHNSLEWGYELKYVVPTYLRQCACGDWTFHSSTIDESMMAVP